MAKTPFTGTPYATAADMIARYDVRTLGDFLSDNELIRLTPAQVLASSVLAVLLAEASGEVEFAALTRKVYSPEDLEAIRDNGGNAAAKLAGVVCAIALRDAFDRRPNRTGDLPKKAQLALADLEKLALGQRIFGALETAEAGEAVETITNAQMFPCPISVRGVRYFGMQYIPGCCGDIRRRCCD